MLKLILFLLSITFMVEGASPPAAYQGRFRPMDVASKLWLNQIYNKQTIKKEHAELFGTTDSAQFLWNLHFKGSKAYQDLPLFWIGSAELKQSLGLDLKQGRFSYLELKEHEKELDPKLQDHIREFENLTSIRIIPSRNLPGEWLSLHALGEEVNQTLYPDSLYAKIHTAYKDQSVEELSALLSEGYATIAGTPYLESIGKTLSYPSLLQLKMEQFYYRYPLTILTLALYACALFLPRGNLPFLLGAFAMHTFLLGLRCYILERAPVSNMFETVVYVPWIAVLFSLIVNKPMIRRAAAGVAISLLAILQVSQLGSGMENVQAVLDSQYWLIIHVLMVVGSYGLFALAGIMGHVYLIRKNSELAGLILQTLYIGTALLITGTILGGVWAAESWGRFWDWDPKESWAFISSCIYLIIIHLYTFRKIKNFGLAVGSILGLCAISFTWYGVNYILGTGLHSYGFGSGGEIGYYLYLLGEGVFLLAVTFKNKINHYA